AARYAALGMTILLFLLSLRRFGEPAECLVERLDGMEKIKTSSAICLRRRLAVLALAMSLLSACATAGSKRVDAAACPSVVEYSRKSQMRAARELALLPL